MYSPNDLIALSKSLPPPVTLLSYLEVHNINKVVINLSNLFIHDSITSELATSYVEAGTATHLNFF